MSSLMQYINHPSVLTVLGLSIGLCAISIGWSWKADREERETQRKLAARRREQQRRDFW